MTTPARTITPKKVQEFPTYLDFERFRAEGIRYIQELAGEVWTDHNSHDPGITMLELLCYALTDIGYRINLPIADLLAQETKQPVDNNFPSAAHVLSCNPLTILDLRKLLIDTEGVRNAWLKVVDEADPNRGEPSLAIDHITRQLTLAPAEKAPPIYINGLYKVLLELDDAYLDQQAAKGQDATGNILTEVWKKLHGHRNFCEDYLSVHVLRDEYISLCGEIEIAADAIPDDIMQEILEGVQEFLSPTIPFFTLAEMMAMGATPDQVFEGRPLNLDKSFGFVDTKQLEKAERRAVIYVSDIYRVLLGAKGITAVKNLRLINHTNGTNPEGEEWVLPLTPDAFRPVLDAVRSIHSLTLSKRDVVYGVDAGQVLSVFRKRMANRLKVLKNANALDLPVPLGTYRGRRTTNLDANSKDSLDYHFSIQNDLPAAYGTSEVSFPSRDTTSTERQRQAQALQLKGYLLFFDQLLSNYLAQLANVRSLFSTTFDYDNDSVLPVGDLADVPFLHKLLPYLSDNPNPTSTYFSEGEIIARVIEPATGHRRIFDTPTKRDAAVKQIIQAFDHDAVYIDYPIEKITNRFRFRIQSRAAQLVVLQSEKTYQDERQAKAAVGMVRFLATLETSYQLRQELPPHAHAYTFDWIYRTPVDFRQVLREILEDKGSYTRRKNQLFSHLLARFAEDFTDYTLLMFGLNKNSDKQPTSETMVRDKARFIQAYPDISRNRGRGLDQHHPKLTVAYWQGSNVSGIEDRLVKMLGFNKRENKQLNFFEIVPGQRRSVLFQDRREVILLQTPRPNQMATTTNFKQALAAAVPHSNAFKPFHCNHERVFGFRVLNQEGCVVAVHPDTYGVCEARDAMLRYTRLVVRDADRLPVDFVARDKGFYAQVLKADGTLLFRSIMTVPTSQEARFLSLAIRRAAADANQYQKYFTPNRGFGFQLRNPKDAAGPNRGDLLAKHPKLYATADERDKALAGSLAYFAENPLQLEVREIPTQFFWQVSLAKDIYFESFHNFKTADQSRAAGARAVALGKAGLHFQVRLQADDTFRVEWIEYRTYPAEQAHEAPRITHIALAQTAPVATQQQAELIIAEIRSSWAPGTVYVKSRPTQFYSRLVLPDGRIRLQDTRLFASAEAAEIAFNDVLEAACQGSWLRDDTINNGCAHGFSLRQNNSGIQLATHPYLYDTARERDEVIANMQSLACAYRILFETEEVSGSWQFELVCPNHEGRLSVLLREPEEAVHATEEESRRAFNRTVRPLLLNLQDSSIKRTGQAGNFSFHLKNEKGEVLANHPETYLEEADRESMVAKLVHCLNAEPANDGFTEQNDTCTCSGDNPLVTDYRHWQVRDANVRVAFYQRVFSTEAEAMVFLGKLKEHYSCQGPCYSEIVLGDGATTADGYWLIRDQTHVLWRSPEPLGSPTLARSAFEKMLLPVLMASLDLNNYRLCPITDPLTQQTRFTIELLNERYKTIAVSDPFDQELMAHQGIGLRHDYTRLFPLRLAPAGVYFQLYNAKEQRVEWRSASAYPTWQQALETFLAFADMLGFESHFHVTGDECGWQVALTEVLLEGRESFDIGQKKTKAEADVFAWDQVEMFLDRYQATDEAQVIYPYVDYPDDCRYRFQLVSNDFALARHPMAFHSSTERETRRDELFLLWKKQLDTQAPAGRLVDQVPPSLIDSLKRLENLFVVVETGPMGKVYLLGVRDETTSFPTVFETEYASEEDLVKAARQLYGEVNEYFEVERLEGKYGFEIRVSAGTEYHQLAGLEKAYEFPRYEVIWESVEGYDKMSDRKLAYEKCLDLLGQKANYSRFRAADGSWVLRLTNPNEVLATQPRRYDTLAACCEAARKALTYVDTEGFHIVEHVLLRPRQVLTTLQNQFLPWQKDQLLPIQVEKIAIEDFIKRQKQSQPRVPDEQYMFDTYIPGSDPYSMTATVVLPYWSRRFRSVDFRQFFENTLRRETPVHVLLNIVWIPPWQMQIFEERLTCWLQELERPQGIAFAHRTACLIEILKRLTNTFPHAILNDCEGAPVILDETTID